MPGQVCVYLFWGKDGHNKQLISFDLDFRELPAGRYYT